MKVRIIQQPTGMINGAPWPAAGETIDLPDHVALGMATSGHAEPVAQKAADRAEKRPAPAKAETRKRPAKKQG